MSMFDKLAEARIRDWQRRGCPNRKQALDSCGGGNLESQLLQEIVALRAAAKKEADERVRAEVLEQARKLKVQLVVLLERTGRPLAARKIEGRLDTPEGQSDASE